MANYYPPLDDIFLALADPTRRAIVNRLTAGEASVTELAAPFSMALPSFMKHINVLERSGLIRTHKQGRTRTCALEETQLAQAQSWLDKQRAQWEAHTDRLAAYVEKLHKQENAP
ncbi:MAG TPA: metalloregulator ArsR/SmtB family transcription factor [Pseudomonadales bacterium]|nr:metalloregulator ArsR/SmtB family transcription factor [Pseudomonadales bacterium]